MSEEFIKQHCNDLIRLLEEIRASNSLTYDDGKFEELAKMSGHRSAEEMFDKWRKNAEINKYDRGVQ